MKFLLRAVIVAAVALTISAVAAGAATPPAKPSAPRNLKAVAGDTQVVLSWNPPATGAGITGYKITTSPADFQSPTVTSSTTLTETGLTNGRTYTYSVRAVNSAGVGAGAYSTATPHVFPPGPPTNLAATQGPNAGDITISWTPPTYNGSNPDGSPQQIDHYTVNVSPGGVSDRIDAPNTLYVAHNTADNITYTFSVTATNKRNVTGKAAVVYSPFPGGASIGLQPSAGTASTAISVTGQLFLKNESITLYWDTTNHVAGTVVTDDNGSFTKVVKVYSGAKPGTHALYANVQPKPHASFALQVAPTPTPTTGPTPGESPSPSSTETPQASGPRTGGGGGGGITGLDILTRPPFVFLPIIGILGLLGVLIYWALSSRRRPMAPSSASVVHHATRPDYMEPFPSTPRSMPPVPPASPPVAPVQPLQPQPPPVQQGPPAFERPPVVSAPPAFQPPPAAPPPPAPQAPPPGPVQWPAPPNPAAAPDEPPDLPEPSD